jgi:hypothetical protein
MKKSFLAVLALCSPFNCKAYEYFLNPIFRASERYNDNINMLADPPQANWITTISPGINFGFRNEKERFMSGFTWNHLAYTNQSELDFDEQSLNANYENKLTDRLSFGFAGLYNNRAALNSTLEASDGVILGNTVFSQQGVENINIGPSITFLFDELNSINLGYSYSQSTFDKSGQQANANSFRSDYNYHQLSGSLSHIFSERDAADLTLSTSRFESKFTGQSQISYNSIAQIGWQHSFTEQLTASVSGGLNYAVTDTTVQIPPQCIPEISLVNSPCFPFKFEAASEKKFNISGIGKIFSVSLQKSFENGSIALGASQNQSPTSQGLQTQTAIFFNTAYKISERIATGLVANYSTAESAAGGNNQFNRINYSVSPSVSWIWTPEINLDLSYTYRQQEFERGQPAQGNILQFQFSYSPQINNQVK